MDKERMIGKANIVRDDLDQLLLNLEADRPRDVIVQWLLHLSEDVCSLLDECRVEIKAKLEQIAAN